MCFGLVAQDDVYLTWVVASSPLGDGGASVMIIISSPDGEAGALLVEGWSPQALAR